MKWAAALLLALVMEVPLAHSATIYCSKSGTTCASPPYSSCTGTNCNAYCSSPAANGYVAYGTPFVYSSSGASDCTQAFTDNQALTVTATAGSGGTISPASQSASQGQSLTFTLTPDAGYYYSGTSGSSCPISSVTGNTLTTGPIVNNCTVNVAFKTDYTVSTSITAGGTITPTSRTVAAGNATSFVVTPNTGYGIASVTGCGGLLSGTTYNTSAINSNCTVSVVFGVLVSTSGTGGKFTPTSKYVGIGNSTTFTITPLSGYSLTGASGCGGSLSGNTYSTGVINAACTVSATFTGSAVGTVTCYDSWGWTMSCEKGASSGCVGTDCSIICTNPAAYGMTQTGSTADYDDYDGAYSCGTVWTGSGGTTYTVTPSVYGGGTISPNTAQSVSSGGTKAFTLTPNTGYALYNVTSTCGGGSLSGGTYTTGAVSANCAVTGNFAAATADGYRVNAGQELMINAHSVCKKITNNNASAIFVPAKTATEWLQFRTNATGISQANCP